MLELMRTVKISDYYQSSWSQAFQRALQECQFQDCTILFPAGNYEFKEESEQSHFAAISNHDSAVNHHFALYLKNCRNVHIRGDNATLIMGSNAVVAVGMTNCENISCQGICVDSAALAYAQGKVVHTSEDFFDIQLDGATDAECINHQLYLNGVLYYGAAEMDSATGGLRAGTCLNFNEDYPTKIPVEALGDNTFRFHGKVALAPQHSSQMVLRYGKRTTPAFFVDRCSNVSLEDITVWHTAGMGVIAQATANIAVRRFCTKRRDGRLFSICADALHFVNCSGRLLVEECYLAHQFDDAINIHGVYSAVAAKTGPCSYRIRRPHPQQAGVPLFAPGNEICQCRSENLELLTRTRVLSCCELTLSDVEITTDTELSEEPNTVLENLTWRPCEVIINNNIMEYNNPRGILASCGGSIRIENNQIRTPYCCISIAGDGQSWFESGAVEDLLISGNYLCGNSAYGATCGVIDIRPHLTQPRTTPYHGNIRIHNNVVEGENPLFVYADSVQNLELSGNKATGSSRYRLQTTNCSTVTDTKMT